MPFKIGQLLLTPGQKSNKFCEIYVAQPNLDKEKIAGIVFVLLEMNNKSPNQLKFIELLVNSFNKFYYENDKLLLREKISAIKTELIFETTLAKVNRSISELFDADKNFIDPKDANITLGVIHDNNLHFATVGHNKIFLIHPDKNQKPENTRKKQEQKNIFKKEIYKITDIAGHEDDANLPVKDKFFSNIVSGTMPENSYTVISNETLLEYISRRQMIDIITKLPPASAVEQFKNMLVGINKLVPFLAIILKNPLPIFSETDRNKISSQKTNFHSGESIVNLNSTEEATEKLLSPSGIINFQKWMNKVFSSRLINKNQRIINIRSKNFLNPIKPIYSIFLYLKRIIFNILAILFYLIKFLLKKDGWKNIFSFIKSLPVRSYRFLYFILLWFVKLHLKYKLIILIIAISVCLFLYNILSAANQKQTAENSDKLNNLISSIEQKQNAIDADLLYNNKNDAEKTINEVEIMLNQLPDKTAAEQEKRKEFLNKFHEQLEKVRLAITITIFKDVADLSKIETNASPDNITINDTGDKIFAKDSVVNKIYPIKTKEGLITATSYDGSEFQALRSPTNTLENGFIFYLSKDKVFRLNTKTDTINEISFNSLPDYANIAAAAGYNSKIYIATKLQNQISVYAQTGGKFLLTQNWLKDNTDIKNTIDMSIDGNIYLLQKSGSIIKLSKGSKVEFNQETISPPISSPEKIITSANLEYIYILETKRKRIIVFDKNGKLYVQYQLTSIDAIKDFTVNEKDKKIFILSGSKIMSFDKK